MLRKQLQKTLKKNIIRVGGVPEHFNLPWHLAMEDGAFEKIGIKINWEDQHGGTGEMTRALDSGGLDIAILLTEGITKSILQGLQAKILQVYVTTPLRWGIHVPFHSAINRSVPALYDSSSFAKVKRCFLS